jgi:hypothetical protein
MAFQVVITWAALRSDPGELKGFIVRSEFDGEINLHGDMINEWNQEI